MRKYYFKDSAGQQQGPMKLDNLKGKGITAETPIWYEGLEKWTTAGQVDELKMLVNPPVAAAAAPVVPAPVAEVVPETPKVVEPAPAATVAAASVTTTAASATTAAASKPQPVAKAPRKKGSSAVTYALSLLVIAGVGYFIYQDMEKNKTSSGEIVLADTATNNANNTVPTTTTPDTTATTTTTDTPADTATVTPTTEPTTTTPTTTTPTTTTTDPAALKKAEDEKKKQLAAKKAADDKKKQLAADAKKKEDEKKKQLAAQAAREAEMRNNWPRYITIGALNYKEDDGIKAFPISISNGMTGALEKVTIRVDYVKKEGKVVGTEMLTLNGIGARSSASVQASGNKKAKKVNVYIVNATSRQMHFCYPVNNGNAADPYYCN